MKEINNFLGVAMPEVDITAVTAADNELAARTVEVHSLHCQHINTSHLATTTAHYDHWHFGLTGFF